MQDIEPNASNRVDRQFLAIRFLVPVPLLVGLASYVLHGEFAAKVDAVIALLLVGDVLALGSWGHDLELCAPIATLS